MLPATRCGDGEGAKPFVAVCEQQASESLVTAVARVAVDRDDIGRLARYPNAGRVRKVMLKAFYVVGRRGRLGLPPLYQRHPLPACREDGQGKCLNESEGGRKG
jgi:hypothetical protein